MSNIIKYFAKEHLVSNLLTLLILALGFISLKNIQRDIWPEVNFEITTVTGVLPGASPGQVEKLVVRPIEEALGEVDGLKKVFSSASQSLALIAIEIDADARDPKLTNEDIQNAINQITSFPAEVETPIVRMIESGQNPVISINVIPKEKGSERLSLESRDVAKKLSDELALIPLVARVEERGVLDKEFSVAAHPDKMRRYRVSLSELISALRAQNITAPSGDYKTSTNDEYLVRLNSELDSIEKIKKTYIRTNEIGVGIQIEDVADVKMDLKKTTQAYRSQGQPSFWLTVLKKKNADALMLVDNVKAYLDRVQKQYSDHFELYVSNDFSIYLKNRLSSLSSNLIFGLILVLIILSLFLPLPVTLIVAVGIPVALLSTVAVMHMTGQSLNMISMIGLIIVTGMVVDDAIVVCENIWRHVEKAEGPISDAVYAGTKEVLVPVTASVLTTVFFFAPMLFMSGIFGSFVYHIPLGVILALGFSWLEAFILMPSHFESWLGPFLNLKKLKAKSEAKTKAPSKFFLLYKTFVEKSLKLRYLMLTLVVAIIAGVSVYLKKTGQFILFPPEGVEAFFILVEGPAETPLKETEHQISLVEDVVKKHIGPEDLKSYRSTTGLIQLDTFDPQSKRGSNYGFVEVSLTPAQLRLNTADDIMALVENPLNEAVTGKFKTSFELQRQGPPQGKPVSVNLKGNNYEVLNEVAEKVMGILNKITGVSEVQNSYTEGKTEWNIIPNSRKMSSVGINTALMAQSLRASFEGLEVTQVRSLDEEMDITVKLAQDQFSSPLKALNRIQIGNQRGQLIPLKSIARFEERSTRLNLPRIDFKRLVNVSADVDLGVITPAEVVVQLTPKIEKLMSSHKNITYDFSGEDADTKESMNSLMQAFLLALALIFILLVITFSSLIQPMLVMVCIPFGFIGASLALVFHGRPFSFMGMLGIIALGGVIVNNSIVLVDFINSARRKGLDLGESIVEASSVRLRPILLTTATTVIGLMPTAYGQEIYNLVGFGGGDPFIIPIALCLGWGLGIGSIMTLIFFPALVRCVDDLVLFGSFIKSKILTFLGV